MSKSFFNYFYFTKTERHGTFLLCSLILISLISPLVHQHWFSNSTPPTFINTPAIAQSPTPSPKNTFFNNEFSDSPKPISFFDFDPNSASKSEFQQLGLSPKVSQTILNFRSKGGKFYQAADFKKIYGISEETFHQLEPYIKIVKTKNEKQTLFAKKEFTPTADKSERLSLPLQLVPFNPNVVEREQLIDMGLPLEVIQRWLNYREKGGRFYQKEDVAKIYGLKPTLFAELAPFVVIEPTEQTAPVRKSTPLQAIDINQATAAEWKELPGIGPAYAKRIIKFRDALGGFHSVEQIAETYGLPDSTFSKIRPYLSPSTIQTTIDLNNVTLQELQLHPYLNYKQAKAIISYREQHGVFSSVEEINKLIALKPEIIRKITPYLVIN